MKKPLALATIVAILAGGYVASSWFLGKKVENVLGRQYKLVQSLPYAKMVKRDYRRGLFRSEETVTFEFLGDMARALAKAQAAKGQSVPKPESFQVTLHSRIQHGPFPGFSRLAAAVGESELILPDSAKEKVSQIFGGKKPITSQTVFHFDGGVTSTIKSPEASATLPSGRAGSMINFVWKGFEAQIDAAPDMQHYTMHGRAPKIEITDDKGTLTLMSNLRLEADQKRIFPDEPFLYAGSQLFSVEEVRVSNANGMQPPVIMKQLKYGIKIPSRGDFLDVGASIGIEKVEAAGKTFGPVHFDFTFKHLHARTVAAMYHGIMQMYAKPTDLTGPPAAVSAQMLAPLRDNAKALLGYAPEFSIDRISFAGPGGEMHLTARVRLNGATPDDLNNPALLLAKLEASGDIAIPETMLMEMLHNSVGKSGGQGSLSKADRTALVRQQIAKLSKQGYLAKENQIIKTHADYKGGQLKLNGKPFPPTAPSPGPGRQPNM